jgi:hypothetical protein
MTTVYAWFSIAAALAHGSSIYRKPSGSQVNVTRMSLENKMTGFYRNDEKFVGEVICTADGGCVCPRTRVAGITG